MSLIGGNAYLRTDIDNLLTPIVSTVESVADLSNLPKWEGRTVYVKSYWKGLGYGGGIYIFNDNVWVLKPTNNCVSVEQFGAKFGPMIELSFNRFPTEQTDNTSAFQNAFDYCLKNSLGLIADNKGCFYFENVKTLQFYGSVPVDLASSTLFFSVAKKQNVKTDPFIQISGNTTYLRNFHIASNSYFGKGIEFNRDYGDNQALTVEKIYVTTCRWGVYVGTGECINRIRFVNCEFVSNYFAGIFIQSFTTTWAQSAPVFFRDVICNGNGPQQWIVAGATYKTTSGAVIPVADSSTDVGCQVYLRGLGGVVWSGGQISAHGSPRSTSLITMYGCNQVSLSDFDLEDVTGYSTDGVAITTTNYLAYDTDLSGGAIIARSVVGLSIRNMNVWNIGTTATIKLMSGTGTIDIGSANVYDGLVYSVWDQTSPATSIFGAGYLHPRLLASPTLSPMAFANSIGKETVATLMHNENGSADGASVDWGLLDSLWVNGSSESAKGYTLSYLQSPKTTLNSTHLYNEIPFPTHASTVGSVNDPYIVKVYVGFSCGTGTDGRFVIQALDSSGNIISADWFDSSGGSHWPISTWSQFIIPTGTVKIRYGFVNSVNYVGNIVEHFWQGGGTRTSSWHLEVWGVMGGGGVMHSKVAPLYSVAVDQWRNGKLSPVAANVTPSTATDVTGVNKTVNSIITALTSAGIMKSS